MPQLNTPNETRDLSEATDYAVSVVEALANERGVSLSDDQKATYAALVISNNFQGCAEVLWSDIISKLFNPEQDTLVEAI